MLWVSNFNSIKVQLEQIASEEGYLALTLFQFHKGTIRTLPCNVKGSPFSVFQFHKGTIRTLQTHRPSQGS